ncbi:MAG: hypothetical protein QXD77_00635 [Candidatus Aenigmatarchaeota archaeon]
MKIVPTPSLSNKVATGLDIVATLAIEQMGVTLHMPAWHPVVLSTVVGLTYALFRWKDEITCAMIDTLGPFQNKNSYSFGAPEPAVIYNRKKRELKERMRKSARSAPMLFVEDGGAF